MTRALADMADFIVALHWHPADYWALTLPERRAIITAHNKMNRKR